jgi:hypothetical protein
MRYAQTVAGTGNTANIMYQRIEDVRVLAGQTAVLSVWLKADSARTVTAAARQYFGSGGSADVNTNFTGSASVTTSWQRFTFTISVPSISGKTIGTSSALEIQFGMPTGTTPTIDYWGVQLESGTTIPTPFQTASGSIQGELALCQRYYFRTQTGTGTPYMGVTVAGGATTTYANIIMKQTMRTTPSSVDFSTIKWQAINNSGNITTASIQDATPENVLLVCGTTGATAGVMNYLIGQTSSSYVGFSAEL